MKPASLIDLNNYIYSSAITVNQHLGQLNKFQQSYSNKKTDLPKWLNNLQHSIDKTRQEIGHIITLKECKTSNTYTKNQLKIKYRLNKEYTNLKQRILEYHLCHSLKAKSAKMKYQKKLIETKRINRQFSSNPNNVYHTMRLN